MRRLLVFAALLSACSGEPEDSGLPAPLSPSTPMGLSDVPTFSIPVGSLAAFALDANDIDVGQQRMEETMSAIPMLMDLKGSMASTTDWRVAEDAADRLLPLLPERMRLGARRDAEQQLVYRLNSLPTLDPEAADALAEHAQSLAQLGSADGDDILRALIRLDGRIDPALRADIAETAARHLGAAFTAQAECVGCTVEQALADMRPRKSESMIPLLYDVQAVHRELVRISRAGNPTP